MKLGDYDVWYEDCGNCGHKTNKSTKPKRREGNKRCWKCGSGIQREYSYRALKNLPRIEAILTTSYQYCDNNNKSTEFMLEYLQSTAKVDLGVVLEFLKKN